MNKRNPDSSAILQVLLDIADSGYGRMRVDDLITKVSTDAPTRKALDAKWHAHQYPSKKIVFTQINIEQRLMHLSDTALKVLLFLGMYCGQSGLIKVSKSTIGTATNIKRTSAAHAIKELIACGAIAIHTAPVRHDASIYAVNPSLFKKGRRIAGETAKFLELAAVPDDDYILNQKQDLVVRSETVTNGIVSYQNVSIESPSGEDQS